MAARCAVQHSAAARCTLRAALSSSRLAQQQHAPCTQPKHSRRSRPSLRSCMPVAAVAAAAVAQRQRQHRARQRRLPRRSARPSPSLQSSRCALLQQRAWHGCLVSVPYPRSAVIALSHSWFAAQGTPQPGVPAADNENECAPSMLCTFQINPTGPGRGPPQQGAAGEGLQPGRLAAAVALGPGPPM